jgi:aspartate/methionine/tyrosine aminotransferase
MSDRVVSSEYMNWAKTQSVARFNLATSGMPNLALNELSASLDDLEITTSFPYGYPPLKQALAKRMEVDESCIVTAAGTTFANHLAIAALINPGDEVLVEQPTYEPLLALIQYLGARVKRFPRRFDNGFAVDLTELEQAMSPDTRLIVLTNLHNPTGVFIGHDSLRRIGDLATRVGSRVLVDEVYLELFFDQRPPTAFHLGPQFVTTSSLTKAFGLSGLRCGWIVAEAELAERMWRLNDLFASTPVHTGERLSMVALAQLDRIADEAKNLLATNRKILREFLDTRNDLETVWPEFGTIVFPRLKHGSADDFCALLREKYETSVVPGRFFEMPQHFRLGIAVDTETLKAGLDRLGKALDEVSKENPQITQMTQMR